MIRERGRGRERKRKEEGGRTRRLSSIAEEARESTTSDGNKLNFLRKQGSELVHRRSGSVVGRDASSKGKCDTRYA
jgi:hypothetical protein